MMNRHPGMLVGAPLAFFLLGVFLFIVPAAILPVNGNWPLTYGLVLIAIWQNWHFGKQNVGVYALDSACAEDRTDVGCRAPDDRRR